MASQNQRFYGKVSIEERGHRPAYFSDVYHKVLIMSWPVFLGGSALIYFSINAFYASIIWSLGNHFTNANPSSYWDAFFFSFQSSTTVGYGYFAPLGFLTNFIAMVDVVNSLFFFGIVTGFAFAKISRPTARVIFSEKMTLERFNGVPTLSFRVANDRSTHISNASVELVALKAELSPEGHEHRKFINLKLVRNRSPIFAFTWTIHHPIDYESPYFNKTAAQILAEKTDLFVSLTGFESALSQTVHAAHSYRAPDIKVNERFVDIVQIKDDETRVIDYSRFHETYVLEAQSV